MCKICCMDWDQLAAELVRALRGKTSQAQLSRRLGYRSNIVQRWESGRSDQLQIGQAVEPGIAYGSPIPVGLNEEKVAGTATGAALAGFRKDGSILDHRMFQLNTSNSSFSAAERPAGPPAGV